MLHAHRRYRGLWIFRPLHYPPFIGERTPGHDLDPSASYLACRLFGFLVRDRIITRDEIRGLMEEKLHVTSPPLGDTKLSSWVNQNRDTLGRRYASELARRVRPRSGLSP